jgi:hypothetical protein
MKNISTTFSARQILSGCMFILFFLSTSCTDKLPNLNEKQITDQDLTMDANEGGILLPGMENSIVQTSAGQYQSDQNHNGDSFIGYLVSPTPFQGNIQNITYAMSDTWNNRVWTAPTENLLNQWVQMKKKSFDTKYPDLYAISLICKVFAGQRLVDVFGPIPYTQYGQASEVSFDSEQQAYDAFFTDIDWAINALTEAEDADPSADQLRFAKFDKSQYGGDYAKWIKVANTLKLRLAMRISLVDPGKAKKEAEEAVSQKYGVLENGDGSLAITPPTENPIEQIAFSWGDTRVGAPVITYLMGFHDPRLAKYALPATDATVAGQYIGIRTGIDITSKDTYVNFSEPNVSKTDPVKVMDVAESYFLRAEGVLRGWNMGGGAAQQYYEDGVRASFAENNVGGVEEYLQDDLSTQTAYVDPKNPDNNSPAVSTITIKWDDNDSFQRKLERVMTQKWIALYPEGREAWAEFRRTGYPKMYLNVVNYSNGIIPNDDFIKRLTYPTAITNASKEAVDEAVSKYLGGKDTQYTAIWWDVN